MTRYQLPGELLSARQLAARLPYSEKTIRRKLGHLARRLPDSRKLVWVWEDVLGELQPVAAPEKQRARHWQLRRGPVAVCPDEHAALKRAFAAARAA